MVGQLAPWSGGGIAVGIAAGEQQRVRGRLGRVAQRIDQRVAEPARHPARGQAGDPGEERHGQRQHPDPVGHQQRRREHEDQPEEDPRAVLFLARRDVEVDRIAARPPEEAGELVGGQREVGAHVQRVAHVRAEEAMRPVRQASDEHRGQPDEERDQVDEIRPQHQPHEMRQGEQQPEEDRDARPTQVVVAEGDLHRKFDHCGARLPAPPVARREVPGAGFEPARSEEPRLLRTVAMPIRLPGLWEDRSQRPSQPATAACQPSFMRSRSNPWLERMWR